MPVWLAFCAVFFRAIASQEVARILEIGMVRTHVHLLVRIHPTTDVSRLMQRLKGGSKGYSIHSVGVRNVAAVRGYLRDQPMHHTDQVITGWEGDSPEYEGPGTDEWRSEGRKRI